MPQRSCFQATVTDNLFTLGPQKGAATRGPADFCKSDMPEIIEIIIRKRFCVARWRHKVSSQVLLAGK